MFGGELLFVLLLAVPMLIALLLLKISCSGPSQPRGTVSSTYWGTYTGQSKTPLPHAHIKLHAPAVDRDPAPAQVAHAHFH